MIHDVIAVLTDSSDLAQYIKGLRIHDEVPAKAFSDGMLLAGNQVAYIHDNLGATLPGIELDSSPDDYSEDLAENNFSTYGIVGVVTSLIVIIGGVVYAKTKHRKTQ